MVRGGIVRKVNIEMVRWVGCWVGEKGEMVRSVKW